MTRKDTIIIAVFVNAAILIAFVIAAVRNHHGGENQPNKGAISLAKLEEKSEAKSKEAKECDEVDLVLKQFAQAAVQPLQEEPGPMAQSALPSLDFVQDIQTIMAPPPAPKPVLIEVNSASEQPATIEVTVHKGDALEKLARIHETTVSEIIRINNLKNTNLQIGQVLKISPGQKKSVKSSSKEGSAPRYYIVEKGDNPWTIAVKNHIKVEDLLRLNNMDEEKARHLKPGDKLRIQ